MLEKFYTSFIESVLAVPPIIHTLNNFEQLYSAGYHIVIGKNESTVVNFERKFFGGTFYLDDLRDSVECHGISIFDRDFLLHVLNEGKESIPHS